MQAADDVGSHALLQRLWSLPGLDVYQGGWSLEHSGMPLAMLGGYAGDWLAHYGRLSQPQLGDISAWSQAQQEALLSEWSRPLFFRLLMPWLTLYILFERCLPLTALQLVQDPQGCPVWCIADCRCSTMPVSATGIMPPRALVEQLLQPCVQLLSQVLSCRARVLWGNAGSYWQWWVHSDHLASLIAALPPAEQAAARWRRQKAQACCDEAAWPSLPGGRNPLYQAMRFRGTPAKPVRRVCCQRYQLPGLAMCDYCPSLLAPARRPARSSTP